MTAAITETQLENASSDADSLSGVVNGAASPGLVVTRTGQNLLTLAAIQALGAGYVSAAQAAAASVAYAYIATYAALRTITAINSAAAPNVFLKGGVALLDGAQGLFYWNASDSRTDDGATIINPTGNIGNGRWNRALADHISVNWWNPPTNQTGDAGPALRSAIAAANVWKVREIRFFGALNFTSQICNATFGWELPGGLTFRGVGQQIGMGGGSGNNYAAWVYNGTTNTDMFDIRGADGTGGAGTTSNIIFKDILIATAVDTGFMSINILRQGAAAYTPGVSTFPNFAQNIVFDNVKASGHFKRWFLLARTSFEIIIMDNCHIENFLRGVQISGCDDCYIGGRHEGNASRHIMVEKQGTYGNSNKLKPNFLGTHAAGDASELHYAIYDTGESTYMETLYAEVDGTQIDAILYLGGAATTIFRPKMYGIPGNPAPPYFRLGPFAVNCVMICPDSPLFSNIAHPIIDSQDPSTFFASGYDNYNITVINPSFSVTARLGTDRRCCIVNGSSRATAGFNRAPLPSMGLSANGPGLARYQISAQDMGFAAPISAGMTGVVVDTAGGNAYQQAIQLPLTNGDGLTLDFVTNREFIAGDQLKFLLLCRCTTAPGAGNLTFAVKKNGVTQSSTNTTSAAYVVLSSTLNTTGYASGDIVQIAIFNNGMSIAGLVGMFELINTSH